MGNSFLPQADEPCGTLSLTGLAPVHTFYSSGAWIEGNATRQLAAIASLRGVKAVAAMPDLHPGKFGPVGCAMLAEQVHPQFVGTDIGCGMGLFQLDTPARKLRADKTAERLRTLEGPWAGDTVAVLSEAGLGSSAFDGSLGTIGGGNHFCEVQAIEEIVEPEAAARAGLDRQLAYVLVHSGSRGLGYSVLERQLADGGAPLDPAGEAGIAYLAAHDATARWAVLNRRIIADRGLVAVPGSRGTLTYLVEPLAAARPETLASLAHGAGRKYDRSAMHGRVGTVKSELERLARNPFGGLVVCEDRNLLVEEAPDAYKAIDRVIADLVEFGLARVVATFRPLVTFKTARGVEPAKLARHTKREEQR